MGTGMSWEAREKKKETRDEERREEEKDDEGIQAEKKIRNCLLFLHSHIESPPS